jgi:hypothetical protein
MAIARRRRNTSVEEVRASFKAQSVEEASIDLTHLPDDEQLELREQIRARIPTPQNVLLARGGVSYMDAWPVALAREPEVVAEFRALWWIVSPPQPRADVWLAFGDLRRSDDGYLILGALTLAPFNDETATKQGINKTVLQAIRPGELLRAGRAALGDTSFWVDLARRRGVSIPAADEEESKRAGTIADKLKVARGRPKLTDAELLELVDAFLVEQEVVYSKLSIYERVRRRLAEEAKARGGEFGLHSQESVKSRLREAVKRKIISAGVKGTANRARGDHYDQIKIRESESKGDSDA